MLDKAQFKNPDNEDPDLYLNLAKKRVQDLYNGRRLQPVALHLDEIYIVWFSKTLLDWKALLSTYREDGLYYEVTYNGHAEETYVDVYVKIINQTVPDLAI